MDEDESQSALEMLAMLSHVQYVFDEKHRGFYRLARPHLRRRPDGVMTLAGARSAPTAKMLGAEVEKGATWMLRGMDIRQPDILTISDDALGRMDPGTRSALGTPVGWAMPTGDLPAWERAAMLESEPLGHHPEDFYTDETCKVFDPEKRKMVDVSRREGVFDMTGPLFLVRKQASGYDIFEMVIKDERGCFSVCRLKPGLDHRRWARLMVMASHGVESVEQRGPSIKSSWMARLPLEMSRAIVDITGEAPEVSEMNDRVHYRVEDEGRARSLVTKTVHSFVATETYRRMRRGAK